MMFKKNTVCYNNSRGDDTMAKEKKEKVTKKKYLILGVIYIAVIILVLYLASWYRTYRDYQENIPVLANVVPEMNQEELDHYITENPNFILYLCSASDSTCRDFETEFKKEIEKNDWKEDLAYINIDKEQESSYLKNLTDKYASKDLMIARTPALAAFEDGKIIAVEEGLNGAPMTISEAIQFMDIYHGEGE